MSLDSAQRDRDQHERSRGAFVLRVESVPTTAAGWQSLRRALRFSRADEPQLREAVPGVVRRGARVDLLPLLDWLNERGFEAGIFPAEGRGSSARTRT